MKESTKKRIEAVRRGEVPEGYVKTEAGTIPADWRSTSLSAISDVLSEQAGNREFETLSISAGIGFVNQAEKFGKELSGKQYAKYTVLRRGDFAYNKGNSKRYPQGCTYMLRERDEAAVPNVFECFRITQGHAEYYEQLFINGFMNKQLTRKINHGVRDDGLLNLTDDDFYSTVLPAPPLAEQQKIAEILSTCDRVIELKRQLLEEKRRQKQWLMQKLLDPNSGVRMPGFENSTWEKATMSSLFTFGSSMAKARDELSDEGDLYLHYGDIHANERYYIDAKAEYGAIPKYDGNSPEKTHLCSGDVVFIDASEDYAGISKFVVIENCDGLTFISGLHTIPCRSRDDRLTLHFKRHCFQAYQFKKQMAFYANGMKVYGISEKDFAKVEVVFPGHEEQNAIAEILDAISLNIELLQEEITAIGNKKKALMQLLLTGLVRVNA